MKTILRLAIISILFYGCKKKDDSDSSNNNAPPASTYYIEGKVDGVMHHTDYVCPYPGCDMTNGNYDDFMNSIAMQRTTSASNAIGWSINIDEVTLDSWQIPDTLDGTWFSGNEHLDLSYYSGSHDSDHNFLVDVVVLGDTSFKMIVTSKKGDVIEGTFSGTLRNGTDDTQHVTVTAGKFKIKLVRI